MRREDRPTLHIAISFAMAVAVQTAFVAFWPHAVGVAPYAVFGVSISAGLWLGRPAAWTSVALLLRAGFVVVTVSFLALWTLMLAASWFSKNANLILPHIDL
jgi:hypothetical protein